MLLLDVRHAFRLLKREVGFTAVAVLTLTLGVGANVAVFAVVNAVLLRPLPYPEPDRLVLLEHRDRRTGVTKEFIAIGDFVDLRARQRSFESLAGYGRDRVVIFAKPEPFDAAALVASVGLLETLRFSPVLGRGFGSVDATDRYRSCRHPRVRRVADALRRRLLCDWQGHQDRIDHEADRWHSAARIPLSRERADGRHPADDGAAPRAGPTKIRLDVRGGAAETRRVARAGARGPDRPLATDGTGIPDAESGIRVLRAAAA